MTTHPESKSESGLSVDEIAELSYEEEVRQHAQPHMPKSIKKIKTIRDGRKTPAGVALRAANQLIELGHERPKTAKQALLNLGRGKITIILQAPTQAGPQAPEERVIETEAVDITDATDDERVEEEVGAQIMRPHNGIPAPDTSSPRKAKTRELPKIRVRRPI